ncbi:DUF1353 domain-containing protein [Rhizobium leguminosarum]|uniref:DUF1353 domain-containing protein n=1 Tax=Rhizobium leguminosarum TaxID=384 RepID=UPI002FF195F6
MSRSLVAASFFLVALFASAAECAEYFGKFVEGPEGRFIPGPDRPEFRLTKPFQFEDPNGLAWKVPDGSIVDGASIPQIFWSLIGGPFEGEYLKASVIHDYFCDVKTRTAHDTHRNFYYGMRANGVPNWKASAMYWAVSTLGPDWRLEERVTNSTICSPSPTGYANCTIVAKVKQELVDVNPVDLGDPNILALATAKLNAIIKTLKTTEGASLDVSPSGAISADEATIEKSASAFRVVLSTKSYVQNADLVGVLAEPKLMPLDDVQTWPGGMLPSFAASPSVKYQPDPMGPMRLSPGEVPTLRERLDIAPYKLVVPLELK